MRVITEVELRDEYKKKSFDSFQLPQGVKLTPAAQQFLSERRIVLIEEGNKSVKKSSIPTKEKKDVSRDKKPENFTHIRANSLVPKNHPRIKFRGKLDSFEASVICLIIEVSVIGYLELAKDLQELLEFTKKLMRAEVMNEGLEELRYQGLSLEEIRERSHFPNKFFGVGHIFPEPTYGKVVAQLNLLRTQARELEVVANDAFSAPEMEERMDILQALNRFSSVIYIMMIQVISGQYKIGR